MRLHVVLSILTLAGGCAAPYVAHVNGVPITAEDVRAEFKRAHGGHEKFLGGLREARAFLERTIDRRLLIEETYRLGYQNDPRIKEAEAEYAAQEAVKRFLRDEIDGKVRVTDAQVREIYDRHTVDLLHIRQIVTATRGEADAALARVAAGEPFEDVARDVSIAQSRAAGGELALIGWGTMEPEWEDVAFSLKEKATSAVFRTDAGWEIVQLLERKKPPVRLSYAKSARRIRDILERRHKEARKRQLANTLWRQYEARVQLPAVELEALRRAKDEPTQQAVAVWRGGQLTVAELAAQLQLDALGELPPARQGDVLGEMIRSMVSAQLARAEARTRGYDRHPEVLKAVQDFREGQMERKLIGEHFLKGVTVSDEEVRAHFEAHKAEMLTPEARHVAHILLADKAEAEQVRAKLAAGTSFEVLAKQHSMDADTKNRGGDLGTVTKKDVPPEFDVVLKLKAGDVSAPLKSPVGYHLVKVSRIDPPRPLTLEEAAEDLKKKLMRQKIEDKRSRWVTSLREAAEIVVDPRELERMAKSLR